MKLYKIKLTPTSSFLTTLRGDTLSGHMCWALRHLKGEAYLENLLQGYTGGRPFAVVSDAFPANWLPKPHMPMSLLGEDPEEKKSNRKKRWISHEDIKKGNYTSAKTDKEIGAELGSALEIHNAINYRSSRTGDGFDPYSYLLHTYPKAMEVYVLIDENRFDKETLEKVVALVGELGFGKKATVGKGRFVLDTVEEIPSEHTGKAYMTLSPSVLDGIDAADLYYEIFVRFGKHGAWLAKQKAFKKPLLMAETASVIIYDDEKNLFFVGKGIDGISEADPKTVHQGYAITIPIGVNHAKL